MLVTKPEIDLDVDRVTKEESKEQRQSLQTALAKLPPPIVDNAPPTTKPFVLDVKSTDVAGREHTISVVIDNDKPVLQWGILQRAAVAKSDIKSPWAKEGLPTIINAIVFAERLGLSFEEGDVFITDGRLSITAKARQKRVLATGRVEGFLVETTEGVDVKWVWRTFKETGTWEGKDLHCKVTVKVKDWKDPLVYETDLREWWNGTNPNWRNRPRYMLEQNALGHAFDRLWPGETSTEEAPPNE